MDEFGYRKPKHGIPAKLLLRRRPDIGAIGDRPTGPLDGDSVFDSTSAIRVRAVQVQDEDILLIARRLLASQGNPIEVEHAVLEESQRFTLREDGLPSQLPKSSVQPGVMPAFRDIEHPAAKIHLSLGKIHEIPLVCVQNLNSEV